MLKRLTLVAFFTGSAQLTTLLALKYLAGTMNAGQLKALGEIDSLVNLIISLIAMGLLMSSVRNIAISNDWAAEMAKAQTARLTMGLFLVPLAIWGVYNNNYIIFLFAPVFALQADYALYGRSYPVLASVISFVRVLTPFCGIYLAIQCGSRWGVAAFFAATILIYFVCGQFIARFFKQPYWYRPSLKSMHSYWQSLSLGIVSLSYYFIGLGLITIAVYFYNDATIAIAYIGCKVYMIFKGVLRMINQSFIKEMTDHPVKLKVDQLASFAGFLFFAGVFFFPDTFIRLLLNKALNFDRNMLLILAIAGLVSSLFTSYTSQAILEKKDRSYAVVAVIATFSAIGCCILFSFFSQTVAGIFWGILAGELISVAGLLRIAGYDNAIRQRAVTFGKYVLLLSLPLGVKIAMGDSYAGFFTGLGLMSLIFLFTFHKRLRL
jgi:hypothetical protein